MAQKPQPQQKPQKSALQQVMDVFGGVAQGMISPMDALNTVKSLGAIGAEFQKASAANPINWAGYQKQVEANKKTPFFNNTGNNPIQWAGKVVEDVKRRGPFEGLQDLSYPVLMNPYVEPVEEPIVSNIRVANYKAGRPLPLVNALLGQTDHQVAPAPDVPQQVMVKGMQSGPNYQQMITQTYKKYGATPDLMAQIPTMSKQIEKNPYLYPYYPAIPIAETSGGKAVTYPGNYFNWGASVKPYPLKDYSPDYITQRVAYRLSTDPTYADFRNKPSVDTLQPHFAPPGSNPNWAPNMQAAVKLFPTITP
jgi:hypothetical protein